MVSEKIIFIALKPIFNGVRLCLFCNFFIKTEKIIFLADKIETRTRPAEYREPITKLLEEGNGLNKALLLCYECTIKSLVDRKLTICTATVDIYNELLNKVK